MTDVTRRDLINAIIGYVKDADIESFKENPHKLCEYFEEIVHSCECTSFKEEDLALLNAIIKDAKGAIAICKSDSPNQAAFIDYRERIMSNANCLKGR
ncbi:MAG: hypothetical protein FVQ80_12535 [Planctomycetes bacterium]|nr:hypothetical protein [Planctomycetota bacterium]